MNLIPYGQLVPKKGMLRYKTARKLGKSTIESYTYVNLVKRENGHREFEVGEDTTKGDPVFVKSLKAIDKLFNSDESLGLQPSQTIIEEDDKQVFEVDAQHYPVRLIRTRYFRIKRGGKDKKGFLEQKVERISH